MTQEPTVWTSNAPGPRLGEQVTLADGTQGVVGAVVAPGPEWIGYDFGRAPIRVLRARWTTTGLEVIKPDFGRCGGKARRRRWERRNG